MKHITYSHKYLKLDDRIHTTIRRFTNQKWEYYSTSEGELFEIWLEPDYSHTYSIGIDRLLLVVDLGYKSFNEKFIEYDTEGLYKLDPKAHNILLIFKKISRC